MRFQRMLGARLLCATGVAVGAAGVATAQPVAYPGVVASPGVQMVLGCPGCAAANQGSYGPALFSPNPKAPFAKGGCEPYCVGRSSYPLSDWLYIRRFCGPTLIPGSCYGHFQTKWRKWEDHCPPGGGAPYAAAPCAPAVPCDMPCAPAAPIPISLPPPPVDVKSVPGIKTSTPAPAPNPPPLEVPPVPVNPPKLPAIPKSIETIIPQPKSVSAVVPQPMPMELPPLPLPATVGAKVSVPVNAETPVPPPPPGEPNRVVVPPLPELPSRK